MPSLKLFLLGPPRVERDGLPISIGRRKAIALLAYLAVTGQPHSRDALAALFWPEADQSRARATLRRVLSDLNKALGETWLETENETVTLGHRERVWLDVTVFQTRLTDSSVQAESGAGNGRLTGLVEAVALYRDDFLAGFTLPDSPEFDDWQFFQTERLRRELAGALAQLVEQYIEREAFEAAISHARRWLGLDPLLEAAHRALMRLYAWTGQRNAALRQYQECARTLNEELGVDPAEETTALYERIRSGEERQRQIEPKGQAVSAAARSAQPPPVSEELRPVTVLFVGLSRATESLWDLQPEDMAAATATLRQVVSQVIAPYEVRLAYAGGEGLQLLFGLPHLHEDDPLRAIQAGLEIRAAAAQQGLPVSLGLSTGQIFFSGGQGAGADEIVAIGPVVDLAARLQHVAESGQILVSSTTHALTRRAFIFQPQAVPLGRGEPVAAYLVHRPLPRLEKVRGLEGLQTTLIGRDDELGQLITALDAVQQGQGQIVTLSGEAGLGKSRLIAELKQTALDWAAQSPLRWLEGRCLEFRRETGYWPFIDLLHDYLGTFNTEEPERSQCLLNGLAELVEQGRISPGRAAELKTYLGNLLSLQFEPGWDDRLKTAGREQIRYETFTAVRDFLVALARQQPLVLVFEDLHWSDDLSLDLLMLLTEAVPTTSLLLVCAYRPEPDHKVLRLNRLAAQRYPDRLTELRLRELSERLSLRLVESLLGIEALPQPLQTLVVDRAQGNPFFLEEAIRALIDAGILSCPAGTWEIRGDARPEISSNVQSVILGRVDRLKPELKQTLQYAAVMGRLFRPSIVAHTLPSAIDLTAALWSLEEAALIYQERVVPEVEYSFKHALTQETVYQTLSRQRRSEIHRRVAEAIEQQYADNLRAYYESLAFHYDRTDRIDRAIEYIILAGQKSCGAYLNDDALHYFSKALKRIEAWSAPDPERERHRLEQRLSALTSLGEIYHGMGRDTEAEPYLREAITLGQRLDISISRMIQLYYWLCEVLHWQGRHEEQVRLGEAGLALLGNLATEPCVEAVLMNQAMAIAYYNLGNSEQFHKLTGRTAQFIEQLPYSEALRPAYLHIVVSHYLQKELAEGLRWIEKLEKLAGQAYDLRALAEAHEHRWSFGFESGRLHDPDLHFDRILDGYTKIGDDSRLWRTLGSMVWTFVMRGDLLQAQQHVERELAVAQRLSREGFMAEALVNRGVVRLAQSAWPEAIESFEAALRFSLQNNWTWLQWWATYGLGRAYLAQGERSKALSTLQEALTMFQPYPWEEWRFRWWPFLANILSGIEAALDDSEAFKRFCRDLPPAKQQQIAALLRDQWWLEPVELLPLPSPDFEDRFSGSPAAGWYWLDPFQDCASETENGLTIRVANGRDLWYLNRSAPRLMRSTSGDFVIQTRLVSPGELEPGLAMGGLLLWQDERNFLRLVWGNRGPSEISFEGSLDNNDLLIGRGRWPEETSGFKGRSQPQPGPSGEPSPAIAGHDPLAFWLRLDRWGDQVHALVSSDGEHWFSVGQITFPAPAGVEVGLHATGWIDRLLYPGAYPEGTTTCFDLFQYWDLSQGKSPNLDD